ncbi:hypothetical protein SMICM304S_04397 [Streptomyces microflavus]
MGAQYGNATGGGTGRGAARQRPNTPPHPRPEHPNRQRESDRSPLLHVSAM